MITFADDHEAELWRSVYAAVVPTMWASENLCIALDEAAALTADDAVLEYRERCGAAVYHDESRRQGAEEEQNRILTIIHRLLEEANKRHDNAMQGEEAAYIGAELDGYDAVMSAITGEEETDG